MLTLLVYPVADGMWAGILSSDQSLVTGSNAYYSAEQVLQAFAAMGYRPDAVEMQPAGIATSSQQSAA